MKTAFYFAIVLLVMVGTFSNCQQAKDRDANSQAFVDTTFAITPTELESAESDTIDINKIRKADSLAMALIIKKPSTKSFNKIRKEISEINSIVEAPPSEQTLMLNDRDEEPSGVTRADVLNNILKTLPKCKRVIRRPGVVKIHVEGFDFTLKGQKIVGLGKLDVSPQLLPAITQTYALLDQYQFNNCQNLHFIIINGIVSGNGASDVLLTTYLTNNQKIWENIMSLSLSIRNANSQPSVDKAVIDAIVKSNENLNQLEGRTTTTPTSTSAQSTSVSSGTQQ